MDSGVWSMEMSQRPVLPTSGEVLVNCESPLETAENTPAHTASQLSVTVRLQRHNHTEDLHPAAAPVIKKK